jgi:hypothetical protein
MFTIYGIPKGRICSFETCTARWSELLTAAIFLMDSGITDRYIFVTQITWHG